MKLMTTIRIGDVFTFKFEGKFRLTILINTVVDKKCNFFYFAMCTDEYAELPNIQSLVNAKVIGSIIPTSYTEEEVIKHQPNIPDLWAFYPQYRPFIFSLLWIGIESSQLPPEDSLEYIGSIKIYKGFDFKGTRRVEKTYSDFISVLGDWKIQKSAFGFKEFPLKSVFEI